MPEQLQAGPELDKKVFEYLNPDVTIRGLPPKYSTDNEAFKKYVLPAIFELGYYIEADIYKTFVGLNIVKRVNDKSVELPYSSDGESLEHAACLAFLDLKEGEG